MTSKNDRTTLSGTALALGMILGALIGFALWILTDTFVFLPAFLGMGVVFALVFEYSAGGRRTH